LSTEERDPSSQNSRNAKEELEKDTRKKIRHSADPKKRLSKESVRIYEGKETRKKRGGVYINVLSRKRKKIILV